MNSSSLRVAWASAGLILTMIVGSPAVADDVELLLSNPAGSNAAKPNILFILDSSGSMTSIETSQEPFDSTQTYTGPCDNNQYYYTTNTSTPSCDPSNLSRIDKSAFLCAQGAMQANASGSFTDTMTMYRPNKKGKMKWRVLKSNSFTRPVECMADSGVHGDGSAGMVYARIGTNVAMYSNDPNQEVAWGSSPTHRIYTVFDGNYLNWFYNPPGTSMSRTDIVKTVTKNVLNSMNNVNVGFMRFHWDQGGPVTHAIKDLDANRSQALSVVDSLPASGWTPLSETMYESALYWRGMARNYGQLSSTDSDALVSGNNGMYDEPADFACSKNFTVLLTDGEPTQDVDVYDKVPDLPNYVTAMGSGSCDGGNVNGACLDDISEYLSKEDINPNVPGMQNVTTYTIGFTVDLDILKDTAENSGGQYYLAEDVQSLTAALTDIVTNIFDRDISFAAPTVAVNAFNRTQHLNDLYVSVFRAKDQHHWPGNLKKYQINQGTIRDANGNPAVDPTTGYFADSALSFWTPAGTPDGANVYEGGAVHHLPDPADRNLYTNIAGYDLTAPGNAIAPGNASNFSLADFGLQGAPGDPSVQDMIDWARGVDIKDEDNDPQTTTRRVMGDTLHSQPASVVYGAGGGGSLNMDIVIYTATNDGYLHAIDGQTGQELWAFVPEQLLSNLGDLYFDNNINFKHYGLDGDIVPIVADRNGNGEIEPGTDFVYLVFGMRRGGTDYYALDVTNKYAPKLKWIKNYSQMGQSWSPPVAAKIATTGGSSPDDAVLIIGAGYDTAHDQAQLPSQPDGEGAGIFMLDLETGAEIWRAGTDAGADLSLAMMTRAIPSRIQVLDMSGDGYADRMYASDLGGQIWRFDVHNGNAPAGLVTGGVIARLGAEGTGTTAIEDTRRFYTTPDVSMFNDDIQDRRYLSISIGSGYRAHPLDNRNDDRFYSIRDPNVFHALDQLEYNAYPIAYDGDFVEVQGDYGVILQPADRGWKLTLPPNEKVISDSQTFDDSVYFVSFEPQTNTVDPCQAGLSINRLYRVNVKNGDAVLGEGDPVPGSPEEADDARVTELDQGGIAPKPTFLFPSPDDPENCTGEECSPTPIGCVGVECFDPGFPNNPVRTLWSQDGVE
ncbi:MAG: PQQ-binding-like beta-propeller repeat protein [Gammaproteobacteria bacterium]|nr:PQQ-binding-like beta-propeller repeat protein [Gammaproteobacteria bacterium]